jgi:hypothetical protein
MLAELETIYQIESKQFSHKFTTPTIVGSSLVILLINVIFRGVSSKSLIGFKQCDLGI